MWKFFTSNAVTIFSRIIPSCSYPLHCNCLKNVNWQLINTDVSHPFVHKVLIGLIFVLLDIFSIPFQWTSSSSCRSGSVFRSGVVHVVVAGSTVVVSGCKQVLLVINFNRKKRFWLCTLSMYFNSAGIDLKWNSSYCAHAENDNSPGNSNAVAPVFVGLRFGCLGGEAWKQIGVPRRWLWAIQQMALSIYVSFWTFPGTHHGHHRRLHWVRLADNKCLPSPYCSSCVASWEMRWPMKFQNRTGQGQGHMWGPWGSFLDGCCKSRYPSGRVGPEKFGLRWQDPIAAVDPTVVNCRHHHHELLRCSWTSSDMVARSGTTRAKGAGEQ